MSFSVDEAGLYALHIAYRYTDEGASIRDSDLQVLVDGEIPFQEAGVQALPRVWSQSEVVHNQGENDRQTETFQVERTATYTVSDESGLYGAYRFYLSAGAHTLELTSQTGGFVLEEVWFGEKEASLIGTDTVFNEAVITVQAEEYAYKNTSSIRGGFNRSEVTVQPSDPMYKKLNVLSSSTFNTVGQRVDYVVDVRETGTYRLGLRYLQNERQGAYVTRRIYVDGVQLGDTQFPYSDDWEYTFAQADGGEARVWLEAGEHTVSFEVVLGEQEEAVRTIDQMVYALNYLYRKIIMITGVSPDALRDYNLHKEIPFLLPVLEEIRVCLNDLYARLEQDEHIQGGEFSIIKQVMLQIEAFKEDPYAIQDELAGFQSNVSSLSSLISTLQQQPLTLDYFSLISSEVQTTEVKSGFFRNLWYQIQALIGSFICDYAFLSTTEGEYADTVTVWFGGSREQAEMLQQIVESRFSAEYDIGVNLQLVMLSLTQAVLAGTAPDVQLSVSRSTPVNLGARGVLEDLSRYEGFTDIQAEYGEALFVPYTWAGKTYALPVTQDFLMMFYRTDVLAEMGLTVPKTWDEMYALISVLQQNNLTIGFPYSSVSTAASFENLGSRDLFVTLLLQNNTSLYNETLTEVCLDEAGVIDVFKEWTTLYTEKGLDLEFSFYNRFRTGEMPLAIQGYGTYNMLASAAPEIKGLWEMAMLPGTVQEDGTISYRTGGGGSGVVMLAGSKHKQAAWKFLQWWVDADTQAEYGNQLEIIFGAASRYAPASDEALTKLPWTPEESQLLLSQKAWVVDLPEVLGGYYVSRGVDNAFRNTVLSGKNYKEALIEQSIKVNAEIARKQQEFAG